MEASRSRNGLLVASMFAISAASCSSMKSTGSLEAVHEVPTSGPEMHAIGFKSGRPGVRDDLLAAVTDPAEAIAALKHNIELINRVRRATFAVAATTDNKECESDECISLSSRRARLVHEWLVSHGLSADRLDSPIGRGSAMPADFDSSEEDRLIARSARIVLQ